MSIHDFARDGNDAKLIISIQSGKNVNEEDNFKWTPLHCASNGGHLKCVRVLILNKADVNAKDLNGSTPLYYAVSHGKFDCVEFLVLKKVPKLIIRITSVRTPLTQAIWNKYFECAKFLIDNGVDIVISDASN